ncbi:hypothetical protein [Cupriavidus gilardii]|uniref:hypothetical protein n=1 Tax=Cupriavidus gilardii TaxID=82541 RepID=UPI0021B3A528|nr:hypothetical protein [Cupriavidus gilardii]UXC37328.1 hypothetical protein N4G38_07795 [Cupriavidus gilardii]
MPQINLPKEAFAAATGTAACVIGRRAVVVRSELDPPSAIIESRAHQLHALLMVMQDTASLIGNMNDSLQDGIFSLAQDLARDIVALARLQTEADHG